MTRAGIALSGVLLLVASSLVGCNEAPAIEALAEAESSLEASRPALERYNPEDLVRLDRVVAEAHRSLEEGRYTDALRVAQRLPSRIEAALAGALARREALAAAWDEVSAPLPGLLARLRRRVARLGATPGSEDDPEPAWVADARRDMDELDRAWDRTRAVYDAGDAAGATEAARAVASGATSLALRLGLEAPRSTRSQSAPPVAGDEIPSSPPTPLPVSPEASAEGG